MSKKIRALLFGAPKDVHSEHTFHSLSLVAMLAWVGLGADGLSSSGSMQRGAIARFGSTISKEAEVFGASQRSLGHELQRLTGIHAFDERDFLRGRATIASAIL